MDGKQAEQDKEDGEPLPDHGRQVHVRHVPLADHRRQGHQSREVDGKRNRHQRSRHNQIEQEHGEILRFSVPRRPIRPANLALHG